MVHPRTLATEQDRRRARMIDTVLGKHKIHEDSIDIVYSPDSPGGE